jgi:hypothetical protein
VALTIRQLVAGKAASLLEAAGTGFLLWLQINAMLMALAACAIPAYLAAGIILVPLSLLADEPVHGFLQEYFFYAFVPLYLATLGIAAFHLLRGSGA